jgi:hypothetical protein
MREAPALLRTMRHVLGFWIHDSTRVRSSRRRSSGNARRRVIGGIRSYFPERRFAGLAEIIRARVVGALRVTRGRSSLGWDDSGTKALVGSQFVLARDVEFRVPPR